jgi:hypothetical protein
MAEETQQSAEYNTPTALTDTLLEQAGLVEGKTTQLPEGSKISVGKLADKTYAPGEEPTLSDFTDLAKDSLKVTASTADTAGLDVTKPTDITAPTLTAAKVTAPSDMTAAKGEVSAGAQPTAQTMTPTDTAVGDLGAAQTGTVQIEGPAIRRLQDGELLTGSTVDLELARQALDFEAAQGTVTRDQTVQGQLEGLMSQFKENQPPPAWAAGAMRQATAVLAARGISASSMAGQAVVQAAMEAAIPIAAQDAQTFAQMSQQNLANRQQTALFAAEQRARFLGQKFDQDFQAKVMNAARIGEIANMNFSAEQQVILENAQLAQTTNLANLNNRQALVMATAAQISALEGQNLNNRQQAELETARAFLAMDMTNLTNEQQSRTINYQGALQRAFTDAGAENAARQFNASSQIQVDQFMAELAVQVANANSNRTAAMRQFNANETNSVAQFNSSLEDSRERFNSEMQAQIDQSNAQWRRDIAVVDTAAANEANRQNALNTLQINQSALNALWQRYRDEASWLVQSSENALSRAHQTALLAMEISGDETMFDKEAEYKTGFTIGNAALSAVLGLITPKKTT